MLMRDMREEKDAISLSLNFLNDDLRSGIVTRKMVERVLCELAQSVLVPLLSPRHFAMAYERKFERKVVDVLRQTS